MAGGYLPLTGTSPPPSQIPIAEGYMLGGSALITNRSLTPSSGNVAGGYLPLTGTSPPPYQIRYMLGCSAPVTNRSSPSSSGNVAGGYLPLTGTSPPLSHIPLGGGYMLGGYAPVTNRCSPSSSGNVGGGYLPLTGTYPLPSQIPIAGGYMLGGYVGSYAPVRNRSPPSSFPCQFGCELSEERKIEMASIMKNAQEKLGICFPDPGLRPGFIAPVGVTYCTNRNSMDAAMREGLKYHENRFRNQYSFGTCTHGSSNPFTGTMEVRTCIWSNDICSWIEKSSGIAWVALQGSDATCVVTLSEHLDWKRVHGGLASTDAKTVLSLFRKCVLSEFQDLADPSSELRKRIKLSIKKPFSVVSVTRDTTETHKGVHETSTAAWFDDQKAIKFLRDKIASDPSFTVNETIRTAISAFQHLFQKKFEAKEIEVTVSTHEHNKFPSLKDLGISQIDEYL